ncbi:MAG: valine--tRNA ligase [Patescibacteria group bacterium]
MESKYTPSLFEAKISDFWEKKGLFTAQVDPKKEPFCIILPPPNANGSMHLGHAMFTYEDIMIRYQKMMGKQTFWLLGLDHAGFETQYVFEKHLKKQGKSRFDYTREELFQTIWDFVMDNKDTIKKQLRRLGYALDWKKEKFTMDPSIVGIVLQTFKDLFDKGLVYRANRLIHYCTSCGTSFSDLEVQYKERIDPLYYIKYGPFTLATVRPETKFGDTALAVNPDDIRYKEWVGQELEIDGLIGPFKIRVIADKAVDPEFGTGVVKVTPAHDFTDYEMAQRHNLPLKQVIGFDGKLNEAAGKYKGLRIFSAREQVVRDMTKKGLIVKIQSDYTHRVGTCYRCGRVLEPLPKEQWFIKVKPLVDDIKKIINKRSLVVYPKRFEKQLVRILDNFIDWNISRQVVWGIRIPAYECQSKKKWFVSLEKPKKCHICGNCDFKQDEDTFDTWFSSSQWPFATLMTESKDIYNYFYPTSVMETGHDILRAWVARMLMIGFFATKQLPFQMIFLHGMVRDGKGQKMSKSKGNVIDPLLLIETYGADALRSALIFGTKEGGDVALSEEKVKGMRNFANKIWNIGRFIEMSSQTNDQSSKHIKNGKKEITENLEKEYESLRREYMINMKKYRFSQALGDVYEFIWHRFADYYLEELKEELKNGNISVLETLKKVYLGNIKMLHPFMPFITEAIGHVFYGEETSLLQIGFK